MTINAKDIAFDSLPEEENKLIEFTVYQILYFSDEINICHK